MAAREFHGLILNQWENQLVWSKDCVDGGEWQDPWYPSAGSGHINPNKEAEWRSESDGVMTGTSGWARWSVRVLDDVNDAGPDGLGHFEFVQVNWSVPFYGRPNITFAVFRNNPDESDTFAHKDTRPPALEIVGTSFNGAVVNTSLEIVPYVLSIPWSFFTGSVPTHIRVTFTVRRRSNAQVQSRLTFSNGAPGRQQMAIQGFRHRMEKAPSAGFVGGFPNFYESIDGRNHFGDTIFLTQAASEWRNIPLSELGNIALDDFGDRMRAINTWASQNGFVGGFPTFFQADYGTGLVYGAVLIKSEGAEFMDIPLSELGNPDLDNFEARFRATQDYASRKGFVGGFPTLFHARAVVDVDVRTGQKKYETVCGTVLLKQGELDIHTLQKRATFAARRNVLLFQDPA
jgi:hypothetical protein